MLDGPRTRLGYCLGSRKVRYVDIVPANGPAGIDFPREAIGIPVMPGDVDFPIVRGYKLRLVTVGCVFCPEQYRVAIVFRALLTASGPAAASAVAGRTVAQGL